MKITSLLPSAAAVMLLATAIFAAATGAQAPQAAPQNSPQGDQPAPGAAQGPPHGGRPMRNFPAPTNLKVLPKDLTGRQVRDIMEKFAGSLGVKCDFCHTADPKNVGADGRPRMNFADDSKPDKQIARIMYTMTQQMNSDYIKKAMDLDPDDMGSPVTCGTCHRGHKMPEDFVIPRQERQAGPGAGPGPGPGAAPSTGSGAPPPATETTPTPN